MSVKAIDREKKKYRISFWYKNKCYRKVIHGNMVCAREIETKMKAALVEKRYFPERFKRPALPFAEAADRFLKEYVVISCRLPRYYAENMRIAKKFFGRKSVDEITPQDIREYRLEGGQRGLSPVTLNHRQKVVRRLFNWLASVDLFSGGNPASSRKVRLENERPYWRTNYLKEKRDFQELIAASDPRIKPIITCAVHTGMRLGEIDQRPRQKAKLVS